MQMLLMLLLLGWMLIWCVYSFERFIDVVVRVDVDVVVGVGVGVGFGVVVDVDLNVLGEVDVDVDVGLPFGVVVDVVVRVCLVVVECGVGVDVNDVADFDQDFDVYCAF